MSFFFRFINYTEVCPLLRVCENEGGGEIMKRRSENLLDTLVRSAHPVVVARATVREHILEIAQGEAAPHLRVAAVCFVRFLQRNFALAIAGAYPRSAVAMDYSF